MMRVAAACLRSQPASCDALRNTLISQTGLCAALRNTLISQTGLCAALRNTPISTETGMRPTDSETADGR